jgi:hypothetical protein
MAAKKAVGKKAGAPSFDAIIEAGKCPPNFRPEAESALG